MVSARRVRLLHVLPSCTASVHARALLIDAMGTLVSLEDPVPRLIALLSDRAGVAVTPAQARDGLRAEIAHYRAHMQQGCDAAGVAALHRRCAGVLRDALGIDLDLEAMTAILLDALRFATYDDARPALVRARAAGTRVIVVSNWDASLPDVLVRTGLAPWIDGVVTSAAVASRKPAPEIFARALELAEVPARECVHVGDSVAEDVAGARAAGISAFLLARSGGPESGPPPPGVPVIRSLGELELDVTSRR